MEPNLDDVTSRVADLKLMVQNFSEERDWDQFHNPKDLAIGIVTEASELLEIFRFKNEAEVALVLKDASSAKKIRDELADVLYFALRLAQKYDIDLSKALEEKININRRRYPVEKAKGSNKKYSEL
jgi:NTP pyrophosphatase (non-canonical NTP hydrolase)